MTEYDPLPDMFACRECGYEFDLARQQYDDNLCPSCKTKDNVWTTWTPCIVCDNRAPSDQMEYVSVSIRGFGTDRVPVCSMGCKGSTMDVPPGSGDLPDIMKLDPGELPYFDAHVAIVNKRHREDE